MVVAVVAVVTAGFTLKPEIFTNAPWFPAPAASLTARCWMFT